MNEKDKVAHIVVGDKNGTPDNVRAHYTGSIILVNDTIDLSLKDFQLSFGNVFPVCLLKSV